MNPNTPLLLSSDSEDNDSEEEEESMLTQVNFMKLQKKERPLGPQELSEIR